VIGPQLGKAAFTWALLITVGAAALLLVVRPGTAEFFITLVTLVIGLIFMGLVIVLVRFFSR
jgi:hypothetical protein